MRHKNLTLLALIFQMNIVVETFISIDLTTKKQKKQVSLHAYVHILVLSWIYALLKSALQT